MEFMAIFKKKSWAAFFIMCIVVLFFGQPVAAAPEHFTFTMNETFVRFHGTLQFFGQDVAPGDEIGVFDENVLINNGCIGATVIENSGFYIVNAYGDDSSTPEQNGALHNESLYFKLWRAGDNIIYDLETVGGVEALWTTTKINDLVEVNLTTVQGGVTADFTYSPVGGCVPLEVQFTDTSQGGPTSWSWNFGDGGTSTEQNPIHTFNSGGSFEVLLVASKGTGTHAINQVIQVSSPPIAQFIGSHFNGVMPLTVEFMDQSQGVPTSWAWNFGDGTTSEIQNPSHTYTEAGTYTVSLQVANECGEDLKEAENNITVSHDGPPSIDAAFTLNITEGCSPSVVSFFDASTRDPNGPPIISWLWNFGDGKTSTEQDPNHEYTWPGAYTVRLIIQNALGETDMYERLVDIQTRSEAAFSANAIYVCPNTPVQFIDESSGVPTHFKWSFGDGESSTESDPVHRYKDPGTYTVRLTVFSLCGVSVKQEAGYIVVKGKPGADFQAEQILLCADLTMEFTDQSSNDEENWVWDFGDGATGSGQNSVHAYDQAGTYEVTLTASNGCDSSAVTKEVMVLGPPVADITVPVGFALSNQQIQFNDSSIGIPNLWLWEFGDGEESTIQNPVHAYTSPGKYTLKLGVKNSCGSAAITKTILVGNQSQAYFAISPDIVCSNVNIQFTNISDPDFDTWLWDFGDGSKSNEKDPNHSFSGVGYLVRLTASNEFSSHEYEELVIVEETPSYSVDVSEGCAPLTVQFQDLSAGTFECLWDFGDGSTSTERNPTHTYAEPRIYIVDLSYSNGCSSAREAENAKTITVEDLLLADFEVDELIGPAPLRVQFQDQSIGSGASNWDFGDGEGSAEQNPSHTYQNPGFHEVSLTAARGNCKQEKVLKGIDVYNPGLIKGQILDSVTNQPISGAGVQILGQANQGLSNANGDYSIPNLRAGYYAVRVSTDGYESALVQEIRIKPSEQTNQDIYLNSAEGNISGVIKGSDSNPIAGATVVALYTGYGGPYSCRAATDQDGKYTVYIGRVGAFKLVASADGFMPKTDDNQGAGYVIDPDNGADDFSGCNILLEPIPLVSDIKIFSLETESQSGTNQGERQTKIIISMDPNFDGDVSVDFDSEVMGENAVGMLSFPQLIDGNRPSYEVVYSDYKGNDIERVGVSIKVNVGSGSITLPYIFTVNAGSASDGKLYLKGVGKNITPAEGGTSYELGWIDIDGDERSDQYDASFVEISPCSIVNVQGNADFEISPLMICLNRVSNPVTSDIVAIYNIELLNEKGEALEDFQVNPDNPIIVHLHCNSVFLGTNAGNLAIKYRDGEEGVWREDGIKNVHASYDMLSFTVTHLTSFALLTVHSAPSHVAVRAVSETQIDITWDDNSEGEMGFEVWRCDNNNPGENKNYNRLIITDPNVTSYSDVSCQMNNTYNYKIRAVTELGATSYSIPAGKVLNDCAFAPKAPQNLIPGFISSKEVVLKWTRDASGCESGFDIYRKTDKNAVYGEKPIGTSPAGETIYKDNDVSAGQTYYYIVKATSDEGDSKPSDELMVTIPGASSVHAPIKGDGGICFLSALNSYASSLGRWITQKIQVITQ